MVYPAAAGSYSPEYLGGSIALTTVAANLVPFTGRTAAGNFWMKFQNPPPNLQLVYTRGGGSRKFEISLFGRSA